MSMSFFKMGIVVSSCCPLILVSLTRIGKVILDDEPTRKKLSSVRGRQIHFPLRKISSPAITTLVSQKDVVTTRKIVLTNTCHDTCYKIKAIEKTITTTVNKLSEKCAHFLLLTGRHFQGLLKHNILSNQCVTKRLSKAILCRVASVM